MTSEINTTLAQWSELFMYLAAITYTVAFLAFAWDVAANSRATLKAENEAELEPEKELVGAGAPAKARASVKNINSVRVSSTEQGTGARGMGYKKSAEAKLAGHVADSSMRWGTSTERRPAARVAVVVLAIGAVIHLAAVLSRGIAAHRVPWGNMYEFCTTGALIVTAVYLITLIFRDVRFVGVLVSGLAVLMMCAATIGFPTPLGHLKPALQTYWIWIHVSIAVLASGIFTITFAMAILQLLQTKREKAILSGETPKWNFMRLVPSSQALENFSFRLNAVAFVMWTFTIIAGAIWAEKAWGRYWGWDTKEVWSFVIWVVYAAYLHARATRGWSGPRSAWLSIAGYCCILFNFGVVNVFFQGLHSYSGL
ncbi:c-type cytochrome biogenesis protein CcsB [Rothia aerolata]|uniref:C-type cytochrome biogenesis protein CcsB n=1 Tax=Rothia aerolata TaxID=1812262 RepID=A0A917IQ27_9MICC|nr:c-type cytochrome biogenesis protein CcsB [Rothia aerolata]GGH61051.1 c-type cytochrome biogenesis protein CcsB [Rothia aerolata]